MRAAAWLCLILLAAPLVLAVDVEDPSKKPVDPAGAVGNPIAIPHAKGMVLLLDKSADPNVKEVESKFEGYGSQLGAQYGKEVEKQAELAAGFLDALQTVQQGTTDGLKAEEAIAEETPNKAGNLADHRLTHEGHRYAKDLDMVAEQQRSFVKRREETIHMRLQRALERLVEYTQDAASREVADADVGVLRMTATEDHINKLIDEAHMRASKHIETQTAEAEKSLQKRLLEAERKWREVTAVSAVKTQAIIHRLRAIAADAERRIVEETKDERDRGRKLLAAARVALKAKKNVALALRRYGLKAAANDAAARLRLAERGMHDQLSVSVHAAQAALASNQYKQQQQLAFAAAKSRQASYVAAIEKHI